MAVQPRPDLRVAAKLFRGFGDPTRLAILEALADAGELRVKDIVERLGGSQSTISGHLSCLKDCGLVHDRHEGRQVFYRISAPEVVEAVRSAEKVLAVAGHRIEICPNYRNDTSA